MCSSDEQEKENGLMIVLNCARCWRMPWIRFALTDLNQVWQKSFKLIKTKKYRAENMYTSVRRSCNFN